MLSLKIKGMTCGHCVMAVTRAIKEVDPAAEVTVDLPSGQADVSSSAPAGAITEAVVEAGYEVLETRDA